jgi:hypothetical protein
MSSRIGIMATPRVFNSTGSLSSLRRIRGWLRIKSPILFQVFHRVTALPRHSLSSTTFAIRTGRATILARIRRPTGNIRPFAKVPGRIRWRPQSEAPADRRSGFIAENTFTLSLWARNRIENVNGSTPLDSEALVKLGTPAGRRALPASEYPIWISLGPQSSDLKLGYRKAGETGFWLGALVSGGERSEATLGPADDDDAPPGALSIGEAARTAVAWAERERARHVGPVAADLLGERETARQAQAEVRAAQYDTERDSALAARDSLRAVIAHLTSECVDLAA